MKKRIASALMAVVVGIALAGSITPPAHAASGCTKYSGYYTSSAHCSSGSGYYQVIVQCQSPWGSKFFRYGNGVKAGSPWTSYASCLPGGHVIWTGVGHWG